MARWKAFRDDIWLSYESPGFVVRKTNIAVGNASEDASKYGLTLGSIISCARYGLTRTKPTLTQRGRDY